MHIYVQRLCHDVKVVRTVWLKIDKRSGAVICNATPIDLCRTASRDASSVKTGATLLLPAAACRQKMHACDPAENLTARLPGSWAGSGAVTREKPVPLKALRQT